LTRSLSPASLSSVVSEHRGSSYKPSTPEPLAAVPPTCGGHWGTAIHWPHVVTIAGHSERERREMSEPPAPVDGTRGRR
jgi:hypothetical protein